MIGEGGRQVERKEVVSPVGGAKQLTAVAWRVLGVGGTGGQGKEAPWNVLEEGIHRRSVGGKG